MDTASLVLILQTSLAPCVLISGVGLILLAMTNRIGRPIDRIRLLTSGLRSDDQRQVILEQIDVLFRRAKLLQWAITFSILSVVFVSMIIFSLFVTGTYGIQSDGVVEVLFSASLVSLVISLLLFLRDIQLGLNSIKIEIDRWTRS